MSLAYIRNYYDVPATKGRRVLFDWPPTEGKEGVIVGSRDAHLRVRFDGEKSATTLHPTWNVVYL